MAQLVVDAFESVEIQIQQHRRNLVALAEGHGTAHRCDKAPPVQTGRQDVMVRRRLGRLGAQTQALGFGNVSGRLSVPSATARRDADGGEQRNADPASDDDSPLPGVLR
jgi:hypothetical protein